MLGFIFVYLLGGITFLPLVAVSILAALWMISPDHAEVNKQRLEGGFGIREAGDEEPVFLTPEKGSHHHHKLERKPSGNEADVAAGYFAVTREWVPGGVNGKPPERPTPGGTSPTESPSVYQSMYRSLFDRKSQAASSVSNNVKGRNVFYVVLRHGHLMLYDDEDQLEVRHVISLGHHVVSIYAGEDEEDIPEGELFIKRNAICLSRKLPNYNSELGPNIKKSRELSKPFFLYSENCSDKEDFYFALVKNQELNPDDAGLASSPLLFDPKHILQLIQRLHSSEEYLETRWLNALAGRLFLSMYKTSEIHDFIRAKITKKIARVKKPNFLSDVVIQKIDMGESVPYVTHPKLKDLTTDGECLAEATLNYTGNFRIEIATTLTINLGSRFKSREVSLVLAAVLKKLEGNIVLRIKPPPSNRLWMSFVENPKMELSLEPIVSSKQITFGPILRVIENRIREVVAETLVMPNWDDMPFGKTLGQPFRGGLWETMNAEIASRKTTNTGAASGSVAEAEKEMGLTGEKIKEREEERPQSSLSEIAEKSQSMPTLQQPISPTRPRARRTASTANRSPTRDENKSGAVSSSVEVKQRSPDGTKKKPKRRSSSITSTAAPVVGMTNINASAEKSEGRPDNDKSDAVSAVLSISRSRSSSGSAPDGKAAPSLATDNVSVDSEAIHDDSSFFESPGLTPASTMSSNRSQISGISNAFGLGKKRSTESIASTQQQQKPGEKAANAMAAVGAAGAFVKQWVITKKQQRDASRACTPTTPIPPAGTPPKPYPAAQPPAISPDVLRDRINGIGSSGASQQQSQHQQQQQQQQQQQSQQPQLSVSTSTPSLRRLPPAEIPLPPAPRRVEPMSIPKRHPLPPPLLPERSKTETVEQQKRPVPPPPLPPRELGHQSGSNGHGSYSDSGHMIVIEAPHSTGNSTPAIEVNDPFAYDHDIPVHISTDDDPMSSSNATFTAESFRNSQNDGGESDGGGGGSSVHSGSYQGSFGGSFDGKEGMLSTSFGSNQASPQASPQSSPRPKIHSRQGSRASSHTSSVSSNASRRYERQDDDIHSRSWSEAEALALRKRVTSEYTGEEGLLPAVFIPNGH